MSLTLHGYWRSSATYRVRIALHLKQLAYEYVPVNLAPGHSEQHSEAYSGLNPSKLVPTLVDDDVDIVLHQSLAIIEYLDEKYPEHHRLLPTNAFDRARVRSLAMDIASDIQPLVNLRVLSQVENEFQADKTAWATQWIETGFASIEQRLQTMAGKFCFDYSVTLADICLVPQVYSAQRFGVDMQQFPRIQKVVENCMALPEFQLAAPENQADAPK